MDQKKCPEWSAVIWSGPKWHQIAKTGQKWVKGGLKWPKMEQGWPVLSDFIGDIGGSIPRVLSGPPNPIFNIHPCWTQQNKGLASWVAEWHQALGLQRLGVHLPVRLGFTKQIPFDPYSAPIPNPSQKIHCIGATNSATNHRVGLLRRGLWADKNKSICGVTISPRGYQTGWTFHRWLVFFWRKRGAVRSPSVLGIGRCHRSCQSASKMAVAVQHWWPPDCHQRSLSHRYAWGGWGASKSGGGGSFNQGVTWRPVKEVQLRGKRNFDRIEKSPGWPPTVLWMNLGTHGA